MTVQVLGLVPASLASLDLPRSWTTELACCMLSEVFLTAYVGAGKLSKNQKLCL